MSDLDLNFPFESGNETNRQFREALDRRRKRDQIRYTQKYLDLGNFLNNELRTELENYSTVYNNLLSIFADKNLLFAEKVQLFYWELIESKQTILADVIKTQFEQSFLPYLSSEAVDLSKTEELQKELSQDSPWFKAYGKQLMESKKLSNLAKFNRIRIQIKAIGGKDNETLEKQYLEEVKNILKTEEENWNKKMQDEGNLEQKLKDLKEKKEALVKCIAEYQKYLSAIEALTHIAASFNPNSKIKELNDGLKKLEQDVTAYDARCKKLQENVGDEQELKSLSAELQKKNVEYDTSLKTANESLDAIKQRFVDATKMSDDYIKKNQDSRIIQKEALKKAILEVADAVAVDIKSKATTEIEEGAKQLSNSGLVENNTGLNNYVKKVKNLANNTPEGDAVNYVEAAREIATSRLDRFVNTISFGLLPGFFGYTKRVTAVEKETRKWSETALLSYNKLQALNGPKNKAKDAYTQDKDEESDKLFDEAIKTLTSEPYSKHLTEANSKILEVVKNDYNITKGLVPAFIAAKKRSESVFASPETQPMPADPSPGSQPAKAA